MLRARIEAAIESAAERVRSAQDAPEAAGKAKTRPASSGRNRGAVEAGRRAPNKTESEYNRLHLLGKGRYEAITLRLPGGSRYTPDWVLIGDEGAVELHEVKGSYRFGSHGRALTAFREAVAAFPCFSFFWATRSTAGDWSIKRYGGSQTCNERGAKKN